MEIDLLDFNGLEIVQLIREAGLNRDVKIVLMSKNVEDSNRWYHFKNCEFKQKPIDESFLESQLREIK